jgi:hypothetical protein
MHNDKGVGPYRQEQEWRHDLKEFFCSAFKHWKDWYGGGSVGLILSLIAAIGFDVPKIVAVIFGLAF